MKLHEKITWYRKHQGMSQEELAEKLGVSRQAVSKWELGEATPELERILGLAELFGISTDALLKDGEPMQAAAAAPEAAERPAPEPESAGARAAAQASREDTSPAAAPGEWTSYMDGKLRGLRGLIQRKGYIAGFIVSLYGIGPLLMALFARAVTRWMERQSHTGPMPFEQVIIQSDLDPAFSETIQVAFSSQDSGPLDLFYGFGTVMIVLGVVIIAGGLGLAWYLKRRSNQTIGG